jgi:hypothetical protein
MDVEWIEVTQDGVQWRGCVKTVMSLLWLHEEAVNFLTS